MLKRGNFYFALTYIYKIIDSHKNIIDNKNMQVKIRNKIDNIYPPFFKEVLNILNIEPKNIRLKKSIIERNKKHNNVNNDLDEYILSMALYSPTSIIPAKNKNYKHFIYETNDDRNALVLVDLSQDNQFYDIVHYYFVKNKRLKSIKRNH